jgi:LysM repeat protein
MRILCWVLIFIGVGCLAGCAAPAATAAISTPTRPITLTPYTPVVRASFTPAPTAPFEQLLPSPTPTPLTHMVVKGEDLLGIALRYGVTVEAIKTANPAVNPNLLSIGTVLIIPGGGKPAPTPANPTPTPLALQLSLPACWPSPDGGLTCFVLAANPGAETLENLAVRVRAGAPGGETLEREAYGLLNLLPPGQSLPLLVFFPAPVPAGALASVELLSAYPLPPEDTRYSPLELREIHKEIAAGGLSVEVSGEALSAAGAQRAWVAAWAFDAQGRLVAARRWEAPAALTGGSPQPFTLTLYSLGGPIAEVMLSSEASP